MSAPAPAPITRSPSHCYCCCYSGIAVYPRGRRPAIRLMRRTWPCIQRWLDAFGLGAAALGCLAKTRLVFSLAGPCSPRPPCPLGGFCRHHSCPCPRTPPTTMSASTTQPYPTVLSVWLSVRVPAPARADPPPLAALLVPFSRPPPTVTAGRTRRRAPGVDMGMGVGIPALGSKPPAARRPASGAICRPPCCRQRAMVSDGRGTP